jgi:hypothetical protein
MSKVHKAGQRIQAGGRRGAKAVGGAAASKVTLGELIAAAFDTVGTEVKDVAKLLSSPDLACAIHRRIVLVP